MREALAMPFETESHIQNNDDRARAQPRDNSYDDCDDSAELVRMAMRDVLDAELEKVASASERRQRTAAFLGKLQRHHDELGREARDAATPAPLHFGMLIETRALATSDDVRRGKRWARGRILACHRDGTVDVASLKSGRQAYSVPRRDVRVPGEPERKSVGATLAERWTQDILPLKKEWGRINRAVKTPQRPKFDARASTSESGKRKKKKSAVVARRARPATRADAKARKTKENDAADSEAAAGIGRKFSAVGRTAVAAARLKVLRARNRVAQCQKNVVERIMRDEDAMALLKRDVKACEAAYAAAATHKDRNHAFDAVTARVNALRLLKAAVIEGCAAWRLACVDLASATGEDASKNDVARRPFLWNGTNYLLSMITSLDFLATSAALAEWYGPKFSLRRNPFMLAVALDDRPPTPRSAVEEFIIGGEKVLKVNPAKAKQREHDQDALDDAWATIKNGPAYLPACDSDQFFRVRNAERVLIDEENVNSHRVREAYLKNA